MRSSSTPARSAAMGTLAAPALIAVLALAVARPAAAAPIACGDTLGAGGWLLEADLTCDSDSGHGVGLTLQSGADLDLGGHRVAMTIAGSGTAIVVAGAGAALHDGSVGSAATGILVTGNGNRLYDLRAAGGLNLGIWVKGASGNLLRDTEVDGVAVNGVVLDGASRNVLDQLTVNDTSGIGPASGILLLDADDNAVTRSQVLRTQCTGVFLERSSRNVICFNTIQDSFVSIGGPSANVLLRDASTGNLLCGNQLSATKAPAVTSDGVNIGCKGDCHCGAFGPSTGATGNVVVGNTARRELRWGFAQATGNGGNTYAADVATGNGVANFAIDP